MNRAKIVQHNDDPTSLVPVILLAQSVHRNSCRLSLLTAFREGFLHGYEQSEEKGKFQTGYKARQYAWNGEQICDVQQVCRNLKVLT